MTPFLLTLGARLEPGVNDLDRTRRAEMAEIIDRALAARPAALRRQLTLFLLLVRWLPVVRYGRPFDRLGPQQQDAVLRWLMDNRLAALRHGFWGVKTMVFMGYYGQPSIARQIGYQPSREGNLLLRAR